MGPSCPIVTMARVPGPCEWPQSSLPGLLSPWLLGPVVCLFLCEEEHFRWETTGLAAPWVWGFLPCFETLPATLQVHVCVPTILTLHAACPASLLSVCVYVVNSRSFNFIAVFGTWGCSALPPRPGGHLEAWRSWRHLRKQPDSSSLWAPLARKQAGWGAFCGSW